MLDLGWTENDWNELLQTARTAFAGTALVRAILPKGPEFEKPTYFVTVPTIVRTPPSFELEIPVPIGPFHLSVPFKVKATQLADRRGVKQLAQMAAQSLGGVESAVLLSGLAPNGSLVVPTPTMLVNNLVSAAETARNSVSEPANKPTDPDSLPKLVAKAIEALQEMGHFGPYALILPAKLYVRYTLLESASRRSPILGILGGGASVVRASVDPATVDPNHSDPTKSVGLLISLGSNPVDIVEAEPLNIGFLRVEAGDVTLRLEERLFLRIMDATALCKLTMTGLR